MAASNALSRGRPRSPDISVSHLRVDLLTMQSVPLIGMKAIWVFGATGLSGRGVARELVDRGADVVVVGRDQNKLASVSESIGEATLRPRWTGLGPLIPAGAMRMTTRQRVAVRPTTSRTMTV